MGDYKEMGLLMRQTRAKKKEVGTQEKQQQEEGEGRAGLGVEDGEKEATAAVGHLSAQGHRGTEVRAQQRGSREQTAESWLADWG